MTVTAVRLRQFRNFTEAHLIPSPLITVLHGPNGAGKTNLVEAIHLCALGKSHRPAKDRDLVGRGFDAARVTVQAHRQDGGHEVTVLLEAGEHKKKQVLLNGKPPRRLGEMMGHVTCVLFSPEDLDLIKGGPSCRRRFMDMLLCQRSAGYFYDLQKYWTALNQRNAVLKAAQGSQDREQTRLLAVWDEQMVKAGAAVVEKRLALIGELEKQVTENYRFLSGSEADAFKLRYRGCAEVGEPVEETLAEGLLKARREDIRKGTSTYGPHREDIVMTLSGRDMRVFASQGQIRTAALALKLSEITLLTRQHGEPPVLLLDDVMSELDMNRRASLLEFIKGVQTLVTCTDKTDYPQGRAEKTYLIETDAAGAGALREE